MVGSAEGRCGVRRDEGGLGFGRLRFSAIFSQLTLEFCRTQLSGHIRKDSFLQRQN